MSDYGFAFAGALVVFFVFVPALTLVAKAALWLRRWRSGDVAGLGSSASYLLVVGPALGSAVWFVSAGLHQSEPGRAMAACVTEHLGDEACACAVAFTVVLLLLTGGAFWRQLRREWQGPRGVRVVAGPSVARLRAVCGGHAVLSRWARRIRVVEGAGDGLRTVGLLWPRIEVDAALVGQLDDRALVAALLHEVAHAATWDPLRQLLASVSLRLNPLGRLLRPELARWRLAREAACDRAAVRMGAEPLSLAHALVVAARPGQGPAPLLSAALGAGGLDAVKLRVHLLLGYADRPTLARRGREWSLVALAVVLLATLPHGAGAGFLDALHRAIEAAITLSAHHP